MTSAGTTLQTTNVGGRSEATCVGKKMTHNITLYCKLMIFRSQNLLFEKSFGLGFFFNMVDHVN